MLEQLNLGRLLSNNISTDATQDTLMLTEDSIIYDLMTFVIRYYEGIEYADFALDQDNLDKLKAEEVKRIWLTIDMLVGKLEESRSKFKSRNVTIFNQKNI